MGLLDSILDSDSGAIGQIAKQLGLPDALAKQAVGALAPALSRGLQRNAARPGGLDSLLGALANGNHQQYLDQPDRIGEATSNAEGNAILGHILGSKDVSRNVAGAASQNTGIDAAILKKMLPMVAGVAMGALSKETSRGSKLSGLSSSGASGDPLSMLTGLLGSGGDDEATDDLLNLAKKFF